MTDPITTPAQMRESAARLAEADAREAEDSIIDAWLKDLAAAIRALPVAEPFCTWPSCNHTAKGQCNPPFGLPVAEPEPVAAQVRAEALEAAAKLATSFLVGDPKNGVPLRNPLAHEIAAAIRALMEKPE